MEHLKIRSRQQNNRNIDDNVREKYKYCENPKQFERTGGLRYGYVLNPVLFTAAVNVKQIKES